VEELGEIMAVEAATADIADVDEVVEPGAGPTDLATLSDSELIQRLRNGENGVLEVLWRRHWAVARRYAVQVCGYSSADDVVSEAFWRTLKTIKNGSGPQVCFRTYLCTVIRNTAAKHALKSRERPVEDLTDRMSVNWVDEIDDGLVNSEVGACFYRLVERDRKMLWLAAVEGLKPREIAENTGLTPVHVAQIVHRARSRFTKYLEEAGIAGPEPAVSADAPKGGMRALGGLLAGGVIGVSLPVFLGSREAFASVAEIAAPPVPPHALAAHLAGSRWLKTLPMAAVVAASAVLVTVMTAGAGKDTTPPVDAVVPAVVVSVETPTAQATPSAPPTVVATTQKPTPTASSAPATHPPASKPAPVAPSRPSPSAKPSPSTQPSPTVAPPPIVIDAVDSGPDAVCYPTVSGRALPGSTVEVNLELAEIVTVVTGADGRWSTGQLTNMAPGGVDVVVSDPSGGQDSAQGRATLATPPGLTYTVTGKALVLAPSGLPGRSAAIALDGQVVATTDGSGDLVYLPLPAAGEHTVTIGYVEPGCQTPQMSVAVTV